MEETCSGSAALANHAPCCDQKGNSSLRWDRIAFLLYNMLPQPVWFRLVVFIYMMSNIIIVFQLLLFFNNTTVLKITTLYIYMIEFSAIRIVASQKEKKWSRKIMVVVIYFILYNNNIIIIILPPHYCIWLLLCIIIIILFLLCAETEANSYGCYIEPLCHLSTANPKTHNGRNAAFHHCGDVVSHEYWRSIYFCGFVFLSVASKL